jgi:hypothetical protein
MGNDAMNILSDTVSVGTLGVLDIRKGRVNVPLSGAAVGDSMNAAANLFTGEQMRDKTADFFSSSTMKGIETAVGIIAGIAVTAGVGSALAAPAAGAEAAAAAGTGVAAADTAAAPLAIEAAGEVAGGGTALAGEGAAAAGIPLASGVAPTAAEAAGAALTGPVGSVAAPVAESAAPGGLANMVGAGEGAGVGGAPLSGLPAVTESAPALASAAPSSVAPEAMSEITGKAATLKTVGAQGFWNSLSPGAQTALITGGFALSNMGTGAMSGLFQGASAKQRLELEQLINSQYQAQIQYKNKNNAYAPLLTFKQPAGLANTPGA